MSEHTPGPWRVSKALPWRIDGPLDGGTGPNCVAEVRRNGPHRTADATLVAAAPDLLEACKSLDRFQQTYEANARDEMPGNDHYATLLMAIVHDARAAIAKATQPEPPAEGDATTE